jgi:tetratricopeptide (TPR) repeat protein
VESASQGPERLESWKEIARYLSRTVRTVQRWEREQGLPVHRLQINKLGSVFAYAHELDEWWERRKLALAHEPTAQNPSVHSELETPEHLVSGPAPASFGASRPWLAIVVLAGIAVALAGVLFLQPRSDGSESERLYALGRQRWNQRTPTAFRDALVLFEQAITANPVNARAHAGLADTYVLMEAFGLLSAQEALPAARAAAERAIELGSDLGEPHASMSFVLWQSGDRAAAMRSIERAVAQEPDYATAHHWHSLYLMDTGRYLPAIEAARRATALDPASPIIKSDLAIILRGAGRHDEAVSLLKDVVKAHPRFADANHQLAELYRHEGNYAGAVDQLVAALRNGDTRPATIARLGWMQAKTGNALGAVNAVARVRQMQAQGERVPPSAFVEALVAAGEFDTAFQIVEEGITDEAEWLIYVQSQPFFEALRADPRWLSVQPRIAPIVAKVAKRSVEHQTDRP